MPLLDKLKAVAASRQPIWLDDAKYASTLLADGFQPWFDAAAYCAWRRRAQSLLRSDVVMFPLGAALQSWAAMHPALLEAMRARRRPLFPLKTLLSDGDVRQHLVDLIGALRASCPDTAFALSCPLPGQLAAHAFLLACDESTAISDDDADGASVYVADLLRGFGELGVDGVLLGDVSDVHRTNAPSFCQPLINVAAHYRWDIGQFLAQPDAGEGLSFIVTAAPADPAITTGVVVGEDFWQADAPPPDSGSFRYAEIPANLAPEVVLRRLEVLRQ